LNITGADRVVVFDPDWNPMDGDRSRDRAWRIGQDREVGVYRLILAGTVEEKLYRREVHKNALSLKALGEKTSQQMDGFQKQDLAGIFQLPMPPPDFSAERLKDLRHRCRAVFEGLGKDEITEEGASSREVKSGMKAVTSGSSSSSGLTRVLQQNVGLQSTAKHSTRVVTGRDGILEKIALSAVEAVRKSARECSSHYKSTPTWTGSRGSAGMPASLARGDEHQGGGLKRARSPEKKSEVDAMGVERLLKRFEKVRAKDAEAKRREKGEAASSSSSRAGALLRDERKIAEMIFQTFLDKHLSRDCKLTTGQVLEHLGQKVSPGQKSLFKTLLQQACVLSQANVAGQPSMWSLRPSLQAKAGEQ